MILFLLLFKSPSSLFCPYIGFIWPLGGFDIFFLTLILNIISSPTLFSTYQFSLESKVNITSTVITMNECILSIMYLSKQFYIFYKELAQILHEHISRAKESGCFSALALKYKFIILYTNICINCQSKQAR